MRIVLLLSWRKKRWRFSSLPLALIACKWNGDNLLVLLHLVLEHIDEHFVFVHLVHTCDILYVSILQSVFLSRYFTFTFARVLIFSNVWISLWDPINNINSFIYVNDANRPIYTHLIFILNMLWILVLKMENSRCFWRN